MLNDGLPRVSPRSRSDPEEFDFFLRSTESDEVTTVQRLLQNEPKVQVAEDCLGTNIIAAMQLDEDLFVRLVEHSGKWQTKGGRDSGAASPYQGYGGIDAPKLVLQAFGPDLQPIEEIDIGSQICKVILDSEKRAIEGAIKRGAALPYYRFLRGQQGEGDRALDKGNVGHMISQIRFHVHGFPGNVRGSHSLLGLGRQIGIRDRRVVLAAELCDPSIFESLCYVFEIISTKDGIKILEARSDFTHTINKIGRRGVIYAVGVEINSEGIFNIDSNNKRTRIARLSRSVVHGGAPERKNLALAVSDNENFVAVLSSFDGKASGGPQAGRKMRTSQVEVFSRVQGSEWHSEAIVQFDPRWIMVGYDMTISDDGAKLCLMQTAGNRKTALQKLTQGDRRRYGIVTEWEDLQRGEHLLFIHAESGQVCQFREYFDPNDYGKLMEESGGVQAFRPYTHHQDSPGLDMSVVDSFSFIPDDDQGMVLQVGRSHYRIPNQNMAQLLRLGIDMKWLRIADHRLEGRNIIRAVSNLQGTPNEANLAAYLEGEMSYEVAVGQQTWFQEFSNAHPKQKRLYEWISKATETNSPDSFSEDRLENRKRIGELLMSAPFSESPEAVAAVLDGVHVGLAAYSYGFQLPSETIKELEDLRNQKFPDTARNRASDKEAEE